MGSGRGGTLGICLPPGFLKKEIRIEERKEIYRILIVKSKGISQLIYVALYFLNVSLLSKFSGCWLLKGCVPPDGKIIFYLIQHILSIPETSSSVSPS
jgi:hypothetical protein